MEVSGRPTSSFGTDISNASGSSTEKFSITGGMLKPFSADSVAQGVFPPPLLPSDTDSQTSVIWSGRPESPISVTDSNITEPERPDSSERAVPSETPLRVLLGGYSTFPESTVDESQPSAGPLVDSSCDLDEFHSHSYHPTSGFLGQQDSSTLELCHRACPVLSASHSTETQSAPATPPCLKASHPSASVSVLICSDASSAVCCISDDEQLPLVTPPMRLPSMSSVRLEASPSVAVQSVRLEASPSIPSMSAPWVRLVARPPEQSGDALPPAVSTAGAPASRDSESSLSRPSPASRPQKESSPSRPSPASRPQKPSILSRRRVRREEVNLPRAASEAAGYGPPIAPGNSSKQHSSISKSSVSVSTRSRSGGASPPVVSQWRRVNRKSPACVITSSTTSLACSSSSTPSTARFSASHSVHAKDAASPSSTVTHSLRASSQPSKTTTSKDNAAPSSLGRAGRASASARSVPPSFPRSAKGPPTAANKPAAHTPISCSRPSVAANMAVRRQCSAPPRLVNASVNAHLMRMESARIRSASAREKVLESLTGRQANRRSVSSQAIPVQATRASPLERPPLVEKGQPQQPPSRQPGRHTGFQDSQSGSLRESFVYCAASGCTPGQCHVSLAEEPRSSAASLGFVASRAYSLQDPCVVSAQAPPSDAANVNCTPTPTAPTSLHSVATSSCLRQSDAEVPRRRRTATEGLAVRFPPDKTASSSRSRGFTQPPCSVAVPLLSADMRTDETKLRPGCSQFLDASGLAKKTSLSARRLVSQKKHTPVGDPVSWRGRRAVVTAIDSNDKKCVLATVTDLPRGSSTGLSRSRNKCWTRTDKPSKARSSSAEIPVAGLGSRLRSSTAPEIVTRGTIPDSWRSAIPAMTSSGVKTFRVSSHFFSDSEYQSNFADAENGRLSPTLPSSDTFGRFSGSGGRISPTYPTAQKSGTSMSLPAEFQYRAVPGFVANRFEESLELDATRVSTARMSLPDRLREYHSVTGHRREPSPSFSVGSAATDGPTHRHVAPVFASLDRTPDSCRVAESEHEMFDALARSLCEPSEAFGVVPSELRRASPRYSQGPVVNVETLVPPAIRTDVHISVLSCPKKEKRLRSMLKLPPNKPSVISSAFVELFCSAVDGVLEANGHATRVAQSGCGNVNVRAEALCKAISYWRDSLGPDLSRAFEDTKWIIDGLES